MLSPVLTVPVLPRFAPVKTSQFTVINRGTVLAKIIMFSRSRCYSGEAPVVFPVLLLCRHGKSRFASVAPHFTSATAGRTMVMTRCLPVLKMMATGINGDPPGFTVAKSVKPVCPGVVPIHLDGVPAKPRFVPEYAGVVPVTHGLRRIIPNWHGRAPVV